MKQIQKQMLANHTDFLYYLAAMVVCYLIGEVLAVVLMNVDQEEGFAPMGFLLALLITGMMLFISISMGMTMEFNMAIRFQRTRKQFFLSYLAEKLVYILLYLLAVFLLFLLEQAVLSVVLPQSRSQMFDEMMGFFGALDWWCYPALILCFLGISMLLGSIVLKMGTKGTVVWVVAWILICLGPIRLSDLDPSQLQGTVFGDALSLWTGIGLSGQAAVIALVGIAGILLSWLMVRRQRVTE